MKTIDFKYLDSDKLRELIYVFSSKKHIFSNYYGIGLTNVKVFESGDNLFLLRHFDGFCRLYIIASDVEIVRSVLFIVPQNTVINIPSKTGVDIWDTLFSGSEIELLAKYHRFNYVNYRKGNKKHLDFAKIDEASVIARHLDHFFSPLTGHLPTISELTEMISNDTVLVNRNEQGIISGALSCQISGRKGELTFWYDYNGNGLSLLYNAFYLCREKDVRIITFWINGENLDTMRLHEMLGAKRDGLIDYIFVKKTK
jgi:hypothetical protein